MRRPKCERCVQKGLSCQYPTNASKKPTISIVASLPSDVRSRKETCVVRPSDNQLAALRTRLLPEGTPSMVTMSGPLTGFLLSHLVRVLETFPAMAAQGDHLPPFIHPRQMSPIRKTSDPLATCFALLRTWHGRCPRTDEPLHATYREEAENLFCGV